MQFNGKFATQQQNARPILAFALEILTCPAIWKPINVQEELAVLMNVVDPRLRVPRSGATVI
jgi:hypothetical protein